MSDTSTDKKRGKSVAGRNSNGTFAKGNTGGPGRKPGPVSVVLREAQEAAQSVALPLVIEAARNGDLNAARVLLQLGLPKLRPVAVAEPIPLPGNSLTDKAQAVIDLVSKGEISTQTGGELAGLMAAACRIEETAELKARLDAIEQKLEEMKHGTN